VKTKLEKYVPFDGTNEFFQCLVSCGLKMTLVDVGKDGWDTPKPGSRENWQRREQTTRKGGGGQ